MHVDLGEGAWLELVEAFVAPDEAREIFDRLAAEIDWRQESIRIAGKVWAQPRLTRYFGDEDATYTYSGLVQRPAPWTALLDQLRDRVSAVADVRFNAVLCNLYRGGDDSMGMHADDEKELGPAPVIASLSFGAPRRFVMVHAKQKERREMLLGDGALLVMAGTTQRLWRHGVPKQKSAPSGCARVNLTFRRILPDARAVRSATAVR